jgi:chemotaxis methyl-accepting protein methylase
MLDDIFTDTATSDPKAAIRYDQADRKAATGIDNLFQQRTSILRTKMEVFAAELFDRLRIRNQNLLSISDNQGKLEAMIENLTKQANYHFRDHREKGNLYDQVTRLEQERRQEEVECWRDVVDVMKDFLIVWEALEQAKARSVFLHA